MIKAANKIVVCTRVMREKSKSGLIIPDDDKQKPELGIVHAIGKGTKPIAMKKGDTIAYRRYADNKIVINGTEYNFISFADVLANVS